MTVGKAFDRLNLWGRPPCLPGQASRVLRAMLPGQWHLGKLEETVPKLMAEGDRIATVMVTATSCVTSGSGCRETLPTVPPPPSF